MEKRSESEIVKKTLTLRFGEKDYEVPVLRMLQAAEWRKSYFAETKDVSASMMVENINDKGELSKAIGNALTGALIAFPEKIPQLVFSYATSLPKEKVTGDAYDHDFAKAFAQIWQVAFSPFLASLGTVLEMQKASGSRSASLAG